MSAWSREAPKEPGYYWCKHRGTLLALMLDGKGPLYPGRRHEMEFGPRIPSPEALEQARAALMRLGESHCEGCDYYHGGTRCNCLVSERREIARAALSALGGPP